MSACVGSGHCCNTAPCVFGMHEMVQEGRKWDAKKGCPYLVKQGIQLRCGLYIGADPKLSAEMAEAMGMGMGCSSTLFNTARDRILAQLSSERSSRAR